jgi:two-component system chemotaxis response regulator CheB
MPKIIVAEDSGVVQRLIKLAIQVDKSIEVVASVTDGEQAVAETLKHKPDVVVMDYRMPKMNGGDALKKIMSQVPTSVIFVSSAVEMKAELLKLGAASFIEKPKELDYTGIATKLINDIKVYSRVKPPVRNY